MDTVLLLKCNECNYTSTRSYAINRHFKSHHAEGHPKLISCSTCSCFFNNQSEINKHEKTKKHVTNLLLRSVNLPAVETKIRARRSINKKLISSN